MKQNEIANSKDFINFTNDLKQVVSSTQIRAHLSVNKEMIIMYWRIGCMILQKQREEGWGTKVTKKISEYLVREFPDSKGFSYTNLNYMLKFAKNYDDMLIFPQVVGKLEIDQLTISPQPVGKNNQQIFYGDYATNIISIPWGHNRVILDKTSAREEAIWYANQVIENGWSRNTLTHHINTDLYLRQANKETKSNNFNQILDTEHSEYLAQLVKDEYQFSIYQGAQISLKERQIEKHLVDNVKDFLMEMGTGFTFVAQQYHLEVGGDDFYVDLLLFNTEINCYVVVELKTGKFKPDYTGQLNFYTAAIDDKLTRKHHNPAIGLLLCEDSNKITVEYSLKKLTTPLAVANYKTKIKEILPNEDELAAKIGKKDFNYNK